MLPAACLGKWHNQCGVFGRSQTELMQASSSEMIVIVGVWMCIAVSVSTFRSSFISNAIIPQGQMYRVKVNRGVSRVKDM